MIFNRVGYFSRYLIFAPKSKYFIFGVCVFIYCYHMLIIRIRFNYTIKNLKLKWNRYKISNAFVSQTARYRIIQDAKGTLVCLPGLESYPVDMTTIETIPNFNIITVRYSGIGRVEITADTHPSWQEWLEQSRDAIKLAEALTPDNIYVLGHSNGANIALLLSLEEKLNGLILVAPAVVEHNKHRFFKSVLTTPYLGHIIINLLKWWYHGDWNNKNNKNQYNQYTIPLAQVQNMWILQNKVKEYIQYNKPQQLTINMIVNNNDHFVAECNEQLPIIKQYGKTTVKMFDHQHNCLHEEDILTHIIKGLP